MVDVIAVSISTLKILWVERDRTERNADAIIGMAILRHGRQDSFFTDAPCGKYQEGDTYDPSGGEQETNASAS